MCACRVDARELSLARTRRTGRRALTSWRLHTSRGRGVYVMQRVVSHAASKTYRRQGPDRPPSWSRVQTRYPALYILKPLGSLHP